MIIINGKTLQDFTKNHADIRNALQDWINKVEEARSLYDEVKTYYEYVLKTATETGALKHPDADNEYTQELGRLGFMLYEFEAIYITPGILKFKSPLVRNIEGELEKRIL